MKRREIKIKALQQLTFKCLMLLGCILINTTSYAEIKLPAIFGSNMVLQRNSEVSVWGTATANSEVTVFTSWNDRSYETTADKEGNWNIKVSTPGAGGPYDIKLSDGEELMLKNVLIGEVWLCSGQSNMERTLRGAGNDPILGSNEAILRSDNPSIRFFTVENEKSEVPEDDFKGDWKVCDRSTAPDFSATGYFFGNLVQEILEVPVGLISSDWGGTRIKRWMDEGTIKTFDPEDWESSPSTLFNAMINPMLGFSIKGVIWYQGESNRKNPEIYDEMMVKLVQSWREKWGIGDFPFYYCQIAPFQYDDTVNTAFLREAQLKASKEIPNSGMVSLLDVGEERNIHPANKRAAGERLAYFALKETYGIEGISARGPEYLEMKIEGATVELMFNERLTSFGKELKWFEVAGKDQKFYHAKARIKGKSVILVSDEVAEPVAARYGFKNFVNGDLYNIHGLPASSFRTDNWVEEK